MPIFSLKQVASQKGVMMNSVEEIEFIRNILSVSKYGVCFNQLNYEKQMIIESEIYRLRKLKDNEAV
jgi:hypothetical protein